MFSAGFEGKLERHQPYRYKHVIPFRTRLDLYKWIKVISVNWLFECEVAKLIFKRVDEMCQLVCKALHLNWNLAFS